MKNICVFCGSNPGKDPAFAEAARELGRALAKSGTGLVYGGGKVGLMGEVADAAMKNGGEVIGVIPEFLRLKEVSHEGLTELIVVESMHERKMKMADLSDGFIAMPGGIGTLEELSEIFTWSQLGLHKKPIGVLNVNGYYQHLIKFFNQMAAQQFLHPKNLQLLCVHEEINGLLKQMAEYIGPEVEKWLERALL